MEDMTKDNSSEYNETFQDYPGLHPVHVMAQLEEGEKELLIHPITPPSYMLRQPSYRWFDFANPLIVGLILSSMILICRV